MSRFSPISVPNPSQDSLQQERQNISTIQFSQPRQQNNAADVLNILARATNIQTSRLERQNREAEADTRAQERAYNEHVKNQIINLDQEFFDATSSLDPKGNEDDRAALQTEVLKYSSTLRRLDDKTHLTPETRSQLHSKIKGIETEYRDVILDYGKRQQKAQEAAATREAQQLFGGVSAKLLTGSTITDIATISFDPDITPDKINSLVFNLVYNTAADSKLAEGFSEEEVQAMFASPIYQEELSKATQAFYTRLTPQIRKIQEDNVKKADQAVIDLVSNEAANGRLDFLRDSLSLSSPEQREAILEESFNKTYTMSLHNAAMGVVDLDLLNNVQSFATLAQVPHSKLVGLGDQIADTLFNGLYGSDQGVAEQYLANLNTQIKDMFGDNLPAAVKRLQDRITDSASGTTQRHTPGSNWTTTNLYRALGSSDFDGASILEQMENFQGSGVALPQSFFDLYNEAEDSFSTLYDANGNVRSRDSRILKYASLVGQLQAYGTNAGYPIDTDAVKTHVDRLMNGSFPEYVAAATYFEKAPTAKRMAMSILDNDDALVFNVLVDKSLFPTVAEADTNLRHQIAMDLVASSKQLGANQKDLDKVIREGIPKKLGNIILSDEGYSLLKVLVAKEFGKDPTASRDKLIKRASDQLKAGYIPITDGFTNTTSFVRSWNTNGYKPSSDLSGLKEAFVDGIRADRNSKYWLTKPKEARYLDHPLTGPSFIEAVPAKRRYIPEDLTPDDRVKIVSENLLSEVPELKSQIEGLQLSAPEVYSGPLLEEVVRQVLSNKFDLMYQPEDVHTTNISIKVMIGPKNQPLPVILSLSPKAQDILIQGVKVTEDQATETDKPKFDWIGFLSKGYPTLYNTPLIPYNTPFMPYNTPFSP